MLVDNKTLSKKEIDLAVSDAAKEYMTEEGYDEVMGVRPLRRVVEQQIRDKVTDFHLQLGCQTSRSRHGRMVSCDQRMKRRTKTKVTQNL